jgi:alkanesulfonate monooxygenase SsuD/methylene tetrahydromethanopterin reductase-like flavin-dependent oxidoreductase (luciferase family)
MPDMTAPLKLGANLWNQYTDWPAFLDAMLRAEDLGFDSLFTWDHVYPIVGTWEGPALEAYTAMAAVASQTRRATIGHLVSANTFRNPALLAKMITTIDHISGGRAVLGIGAAWMEPEHTAFGLEYGDRPGTRLRWLAEALPIVRGMLDGTQPSSPPEGRYAVQAVRNDPPPIQRRIPILIGGSGPRVTLRLVAEYADMNNLGNPIDAVLHSEAILVEHCRDLGRDERQIERTVELQRVVIRDSRAAALQADADMLAANGGAEVDEVRPGSADVDSDRVIAGDPDEVYEQLAPYVEAGYRHLICGFPSPYDAETMRRMATDVRPRLEALVAR